MFVEDYGIWLKTRYYYIDFSFKKITDEFDSDKGRATSCALYKNSEPILVFTQEIPLDNKGYKCRLFSSESGVIILSYNIDYSEEPRENILKAFINTLKNTNAHQDIVFELEKVLE